MTKRTTRTTLFPYTTLFRSKEKIEARNVLIKENEFEKAKEKVNEEEELQRKLKSLQNKKVETSKRVDRKSTRLNSSHVAISYAVFCLKKKKSDNEKKTEAYY